MAAVMTGSARRGSGIPTTPLLWAGLAAPLLLWGLGAVVAATWPGYDPVAQSISSLANAPLGWLQTVAFLAGGVLGVAWAVGAARVIGAMSRDRRLVLVLFLLQAAISVGFGVLPTDPAGVPTTAVGALHLAVFYAYAILTPASLLLLGRVFRRDPRWAGLARATSLAGAAMLLATVLVPITIAGPLEPWTGLLERVHVAVPTTWQAAVAIRALRVVPSAPGSHASHGPD